jgi:hypothetical protein
MPRVVPEQLELEAAPHEPPPTRGTDRRKTATRKLGLPRLALTFAESAAMLGVSDEFFAEHVAHELRFVRRGRKKLVAIRELERWLEESATREAL